MSQPGQSAGAIFDAALELPMEQRAAFLEKACAGDAPLRERVEALLRAHEKADSFMDGPSLKAPPNTLTLPLLDQSGQTIGRYKLLQQIGEGGCSSKPSRPNPRGRSQIGQPRSHSTPLEERL